MTTDIGVCIFATDYAIPIDEPARETEARGFESLWVPEHTHIPASRRTPWPGGGGLPKEYSYTYDPFVSLVYAAAVTKTLKLGTGICLIIERDTITTAKEIASLDRLSGGRFLFGIGGGWNAEEMSHSSRFSWNLQMVMPGETAPSHTDGHTLRVEDQRCHHDRQRRASHDAFRRPHPDAELVLARAYQRHQ